MCEILTQIWEEYLEQRAGQLLAYGVIHTDTDHPHLHLCISANNLWESKRAYLTKKQFSGVQKCLEQFAIKHFPELKQSQIYSLEQGRENSIKTVQREQEMKRRTRQPSKKEELKNTLHAVFDQAPDQAGLQMILKNRWLSLYQRGKTFWVVDQKGKKHRLKTLWLSRHFETLQNRFAIKEKKEQEKKQSVELEVNRKMNIILSSRAGQTLPGPAEQNKRLQELNKITQRNKALNYSLTQQKMNSAQAKALPLLTVLEKLWYQPHHREKNDVWFISPFREEKTPSFKVNLNLNTWYDFGGWGQGGTIIDLFMCLYSLDSISKALGMIDQLGYGSALAPIQKVAPVRSRQPVKKPVIEDIRPIENLALIQYLASKWIDVELARLYLSEIHYQQGESTFYSLGYPNTSQGYEHRNKHFKGTLWSKAITVFEWSEQKGGRVAIFEGITDFLSLLHLHQKQHNPIDVIILNSVSLTQQAVAEIKKRGYTQAQAYLDNDTAGREAFKFLSESLPEVTLTDHSGAYANFKDLNESWVHKNQLKMELDRQVQTASLTQGQSLEISL